MGTVLAMKIFKPFRIAAALGFVASLLACSSVGPNPLVESFRTIGTQLTNRDPAARDVRAVLTPAIVAANRQPHLLVELPSRQASATRFLFNQRGPIQDWRGQDGISLTLHNDVLIRTRGLGADLFAADPMPANSLQDPNTMHYSRTYRHLDGENREILTHYQCSLAQGSRASVDLIARHVATMSVVETCKTVDPGASDIRNEYWIGTADSITWKSKQWVSESVGYATLYHLVR
jgi:hypothetical protein